MNNDFWIFCRTKTCLVLVIDVYDPAYMERSREERFSELKSLLTHDIMSIKKVYLQYTYTISELKLKADWIAIERPGPGYCHFPAKPDEYNKEFFAQLTAEKRFKKWVRGAQVWAYKKLRPRNEALDKRNYARGALNITGIDVDKFADAGKKFLRNLNAPVHRRRGLMISGGVSV